MPSAELLARLRLNALARRLTPQLAARFLRVITALRNATDIERLAAQVQAGDVTGALRELLGTPDATTALNSIGDGYRDAMRASATAWGADPVAIPGAGLSGTTAAALAGDAASVTVRLGVDTAHPAVIAALAEQRRRAIVQATHSIAAGARVTVIDAVERTTRAGLNPKVAAREIRDVLGLSERDARWVQSFREQITNGDPVALERELRDKRYDGALSRAVNGGAPLSDAEVEKMVAAYEKFARQNTAERSAHDAALDAAREGQRATWLSAIESGQVDGANVRKRWVATHDSRTRPAHRALDGVTIGMDEEWFDTDDDTYKLVPSGFGCRCVAVYTLDVVGPARNARPTATAPGQIRGGFAEIERAARRRAA